MNCIQMKTIHWWNMSLMENNEWLYLLIYEDNVHLRSSGWKLTIIQFQKDLPESNSPLSDLVRKKWNQNLMINAPERSEKS